MKEQITEHTTLGSCFLRPEGMITVRRRSDIPDQLTLSFGSCTFIEQTVSSAGAVALLPAPLRQGQSFVSMQPAFQSSNFLMGNLLNPTELLLK